MSRGRRQRDTDGVDERIQEAKRMALGALDLLIMVHEDDKAMILGEAIDKIFDAPGEEQSEEEEEQSEDKAKIRRPKKMQKAARR